MKPILRAFAATVLLPLLLLGSPLAVAYTPGCYKEVQKLCGDVEPGEGRLTDCVTHNQARFSPACRPEIHGMIEQRGRFTTHCKSHAATLCPGVKAGSGRLYACLRFHEEQLGTACRALFQ